MDLINFSTSFLLNHFMFSALVLYFLEFLLNKFVLNLMPFDQEKNWLYLGYIQSVIYFLIAFGANKLNLKNQFIKFKKSDLRL